MVEMAEEMHQSYVVPYGHECSRAFPAREVASSLKQVQPICSSARGILMLASCKATGASLDVIEKLVEESHSIVSDTITDNPFDGAMLETRGGDDFELQSCLSDYSDGDRLRTEGGEVRGEQNIKWSEPSISERSNKSEGELK